ncbi:MAG: response regulator [Flavobacteriales bacterium]|nr:response regulator [Flavobacteriales bacterium]
MNRDLSILMIEDNPVDQQFFRELFDSTNLRGSALHIASRVSEGLDILKRYHVDVMLLDLSLPDSSHLDGYTEIKKKYPHLPIIIMTGLSDHKTAVRAIQLGAQDYLEKGKYDDYLMEKSIRYAIERQNLLKERERVSQELENSLKMLDSVNSELKVLNEGLEEKVRSRTIDLEKEKEKVEEQNQLIRESLRYARKIQSAILPKGKELAGSLPNSFVFFKPKDIVSGDFYWHASVRNRDILAVADCTGHGVPGAMMSMLGFTQLNLLVEGQRLTDPAGILNKLHQHIRQLLNQAHESVESPDGMDIGLCSIDREEKTIAFAGAMRPMYMFRKGELNIVEGDRYPIAGKHINGVEQFQDKHVPYQEGDMMYLFTDGFADQFGERTGKKFKTKKFRDLLKEIHDKDIVEQKRILEEQFTKWKGSEEQVDDILVIGVRF